MQVNPISLLFPRHWAVYNRVSCRRTLKVSRSILTSSAHCGTRCPLTLSAY
jgi:hypothetical protein